MAAVNAIRTYLKDVIGLGPGATGTEKANAIIEEDLDNVTVLAEMYEEDGDIISTMCSNVRKPVGQIPQPGWVAPEVAAGAPAPVTPMIPKPGLSIPVICEQRLMMAVAAM